MTHRLIFTLAVLCFTVFPGHAYAQEPASGEITGQVVNGTAGGGSVAGVEVTLIEYVAGVLSTTKTTSTDSAGEFRFENVAVEHSYFVTANYLDVDYYYPVEFEPGASTTRVEVGVCDVTASDEAIAVALAHAIIEVNEDNIRITQLYWLVNKSDMTYAGIDGALIFTLPDGAYDFAATEELMIDFQRLDDNRVSYLVPFPPGERELFYYYRLARPDTAEFTISLKTDYPTENLEFMITGEDIEVTASQMAPADPVTIDTGQRFLHFQGKNLPRDMLITISVNSLAGGRGIPWAIIGITAAILAAGAAYYLIRRRRAIGGA